MILWDVDLIIPPDASSGIFGGDETTDLIIAGGLLSAPAMFAVGNRQGKKRNKRG